MCDCIKTVNAQMAAEGRNTVIKLPLMLDGSEGHPFVETTQAETGRGKKRAVSLLASCCPFCGERYSTGSVDGALVLNEALGRLRELVAAVDAYRSAHDLKGDGSREAGRAWDLMRRSSEAAAMFVNHANTGKAQADGN